jgi:hypothetical protein
VVGTSGTVPLPALDVAPPPLVEVPPAPAALLSLPAAAPPPVEYERPMISDDEQAESQIAVSAEQARR